MQITLLAKGTKIVTPDQIRELATNALTGHWPAHLGANSDAERIEYLARQLETVTTEIRDAEELEDKIETLETANDALQRDLDEANERIKKLEKT